MSADQTRVLSYRPRAREFRARLAAAESRDDAVAAGFEAVAELERVLAWVRSEGLVPPKDWAKANERRQA